ncbi:MAG: N-acetyl-gamma-glutamyl-phosphate reductase [Phycisphaerales bacterium]|nr:N-acetyl-gamma-glutamyl-phosphate reductase [Phycisphaerales bacterium]
MHTTRTTPTFVSSAPTPRALRVAIVGATGYAGCELCTILLSHPHVEVVAVYGSARRADEPTQRLADLFPRLEGCTELCVFPLDADALASSGVDAVFLATPHETSHALAPALLAQGILVVDLSAAFRLSNAAIFERAYGFAHEHPQLLADAIYALPEIAGEKIAQSNLLAIPGCYPTSMILPTRPLVDAGLIDLERGAIVDSTSGVSGAGRKAEIKTLFCEVSMQAYGVWKHRHRPEMTEHARIATVFTPHLGCFDRGILSTIHLFLNNGVTEADARACLEESYAQSAFVRVLRAGQWPAIAHVERTNHCDIGLAAEGRHLILESALDNLVKGAAGQAVQAFNIRCGFAQTTALLAPSTTKEAACLTH